MKCSKCGLSPKKVRIMRKKIRSLNEIISNYKIKINKIKHIIGELK